MIDQRYHNKDHTMNTAPKILKYIASKVYLYTVITSRIACLSKAQIVILDTHEVQNVCIIVENNRNNNIIKLKHINIIPDARMEE